MNKHIFSIYFENLNINSDFILIKKDDLLFHRIINILRLKNNEELILFDKDNKLNLSIENIEKKEIKLKIIKKEKIEKPKNKIILYLPILEKDYLEIALFSCGQQGINEINFINYQKCHKFGNFEKNFDRLEKILISGCEQGKQYFIPKINKNIISFNEMIEKNKNNLIWFDEKGFSLKDKIKNDENFLNKNEYIYTCGPEAGFSENELNILNKDLNKNCISLGKSILRSCDTICFINNLFRLK